MKWRAELQQQPIAPNGIMERALHLWCWYYEEAEAFDRTLCTGPVTRAGVVPATHEQRAAITAHARELLGIVEWWVARLGADADVSAAARFIACRRDRG